MNIPEGLPTSGMIQEAFAEAMNRRLAVGIDDITAILKTALAAAPTSPAGDLPRYGIKWQGPQEPICVPMEDGYWTPWHLAVNETPPAQDEPVAWIRGSGLEMLRQKQAATVFHSPHCSNYSTPLYPRPDNDKLRKAAEAAIEALEWYHQEQLAENLRTALEGK